MAKDHIGHVACPCCGEDAEVREQKSGRGYILCQSPACGFQGFARSADADKHLRTKMRPKGAPAAVQPQPEKKVSWLEQL